MIHWNYKLIKSSHGEYPTRLALCSKTGNCLITFKVTTIANSWSAAPWGAMKSQHRSARVWGWVDVGCRGWGEYIECLCAGLIVAEWAHKTKDLLSLAGEFLQSGNSAQASKKSPVLVWLGSSNNVQPCVGLSLSLKAASVPGGWEGPRN